MIFDVQAATNLVVWIVFVYWNPFPMGENSYDYYRENYEKKLKNFIPLAPWLFAPFWFFLNAMRVAYIFLFMQSISSSSDLTSYHLTLPIYILFVVGELLQKSWTPVFFQLKRPGLAFVIGFLIFGTAGSIIGLTAAHEIFNANDYVAWILCIVFFSAYALWIAFANTITYVWWMNSDSNFPYTKLPMEAQISAGGMTVGRHGFKTL